MRRRLLPCLLLLAACNKDEKKDAPAAVTDAASPVFDAAFWKIWSDGNAELSSYSLRYPRYGKPREGTAVAIFVTETFANSLRVKSDPGVRDKKDEFPVMKMNLAEEVQTGIYGYHMMLQSLV